MENDDSKIFRVQYEAWKFSFPISKGYDVIANSMMKHEKFYENQFLHALRMKVSPSGVALDCGANIGNHSVFFAGVMGMKTYAFEPVLRNRNMLEKAVKLNLLSERVTLVPKALSDQERIVSLSCPPGGNPGMFTIVEVGDGETVEATTIDAYLDENNVSDPVNLIKIDVEGHEQEVLKGALNTIKKYRPVVTAEFVDTRSFTRFLKALEGYGYVANEKFNATPTVVFGCSDTFKDNGARVLKTIEWYERKR